MEVHHRLPELRVGEVSARGVNCLMAKDLTPILADFGLDTGGVRARRIVASDGQMFLQLRIDLGVLQMHAEGRPDGQPSLLDLTQSRLSQSKGPIEVSQEELGELVREMLQYYRRRVTWMTLAKQAQSNDDLEEADAAYGAAIRDAEHNLAILDFFARSHVNLEVVEEQEQHRPFVLMHRAVCQAERALLDQDPDAAIEFLQTGALDIERCGESAEPHEPSLDLRPFLHELRTFERQIRKRYRRRRTLREQLADAVAAEDFERAARLRDVLAERTRHKRV